MKVLCLFDPSQKEKQLYQALVFIRENDVHMGHFKATCPNPFSGEKVHSYPADGLIIDLVSKNGLWMLKEEYTIMRDHSDDAVEAKFEELENSIEELLHKFRGARAAKKYSL
jgi:hypothetical protein